VKTCLWIMLEDEGEIDDGSLEVKREAPQLASRGMGAKLRDLSSLRFSLTAYTQE
jgi:hypothetical protein